MLRSFFGTTTGLDRLPSPPYLIASNHVGSIDYAFIAAALHRSIPGYIHFVAQSEWWRNYFIKYQLHCIIVDPRNKDRCLDEAEHYLRAGEVCLIFPEGRASRNHPELLPGKLGVARLALRTGVPVVPVGFTGPWGRGSLARTLRGFRELYKKTELHVGRSMRWPAQKEGQTITPDQLAATTRAIMTEIGRLCRKTYPH